MKKLFGWTRVAGKRDLLQKDDGGVLIIVAITLMLLLGFFALAIEGGRWYLVQAELSKSVDAAALAGARNISNPHVDPKILAEDFGAANYSPGYLHTISSGSGGLSFDAEFIDGSKVKVDGFTTALPILAQLFGVDEVPISTVAAAQMQEVEIMMVLDRSYSMVGDPMIDLKEAATSFVGYFEDTQANDQMGLITFATSVTVEQPLGTNYVDDMEDAIHNMLPLGATNTEDALDQANGPFGFTDQSGLAPERRRPKFLVFFSDGSPTAFRSTFKQDDETMDAVACVSGNCDDLDIGYNCRTWYLLGFPDIEKWTEIDPRATGDGKNKNASQCTGLVTTKWSIFDEFPVPGYSPEECNIPPDTELTTQICRLAPFLALQHAQELKDEGIIIFTIGLGKVKPDFLNALATSPEQAYYTPDSDQLSSIFQDIAKQIKLRLVL
jgi:hypothetical protein